MAKLKTFSGRSQCPLNHWLRSVECTAASQHLSEVQKLATACALLVDDAATWLGYREFDIWQDFCNAFKERFGYSPEQELDQLMTIQQGKKEDVETYLARFKAKVATLVESGNVVPELMQMKWFIDGLESNLKQKIKDRRPKTLADAACDASYFAMLSSENAAQPLNDFVNAPAYQQKSPREQHIKTAWPTFQVYEAHAPLHPRYSDYRPLNDLLQAIADQIDALENAVKHQLPHELGHSNHANYVCDVDYAQHDDWKLPHGMLPPPDPDPDDTHVNSRPESPSMHDHIDLLPYCGADHPT